MKQSKAQVRNKLMIVVAAVLVMALVYAFMPRATLVDIGSVERATMRVTIDEEGRSRVRDAYIVSAPIVGRLLRLDVEPGDIVVGGETVIARMQASPPSAIDVRTREQARAGVEAALAALRVARADLNKALADQDFSNAEVTRIRALRANGTVAETSLDQAVRAMRTADASVDTAKAAISMREAEVANARARLIGFNVQSIGGNQANGAGADIPLQAPISGRILRVMHESETTLAAGEPILEIGDISNDLEVVAELLSTDAVQVSVGDKVIIDNWGGQQPLNGIVERVEPWGFTKFSALGVEEQRVNTIIRLQDPIELRQSLGHGYRVETRIVIWEKESALTVPSSALFRSRDGWAVFRVVDGVAEMTSVTPGRNNGLQVEVIEGLSDGDRVVLYPGPGLLDGSRVRSIGEQ